MANPTVQKAVAQFDKMPPNLKLYRDVFEYMESYLFEGEKDSS